MKRTQNRIAIIVATMISLSSCISTAPKEDLAKRTPNAEENRNYPLDKFSTGYVLLDRLDERMIGQRVDKSGEKIKDLVKPIMFQEDKDRVREYNLQQFEPLYYFNKHAHNLPLDEQFNNDKQGKSKLPWLLDQSLNVTNKEDAEKIVKILQRYAYEGWFDTDKTEDKSNYEIQFRENKERTWCHTPWLNITEKGREAIHGLTKEFPISTTSVYTIPEDIEKNKTAVTWGLAFFNKPVCNSYASFFRQGDMINQLRETNPTFNSGDGAVSFKLLFNTMDDWRTKMKGQWTKDNLEAYNWWAHVSNANQDSKNPSKANSVRKIRNIAHVQMDIGLKDSRLAGTKKALQHWVMTTYYFDPAYTNEYLKDMNIPEPLRHMRPVGLQYGLDAGESHIFEGAHNNHRPGEKFGGNGTELPYERTRLNGPVDNVEGSCLGCHATAGLRFNPKPMEESRKEAALQNRKQFPPLSFMTEAEYLKFTLDKKGNFDFNMQIDKVMRNFLNSKADKILYPEAQK